MYFFSADGTYRGAIYGVVPPEFAITNTARDGEYYAAYMASVHVLGEFSLRADCKATLSCCSDVRKSTGVTNPRAHLWIRVHGREEFQISLFSMSLRIARWWTCGKES